jgi:phage/plasmid-associated DNA primase
LKHYPSIAGTSFQSNAVRFLSDLLLDNQFSEKLDNNKGFLAFKNGILNLRTGKHKLGLLPEHYITFTLDYDYKEITVDNSCEVWKQFKKVINNSETELDYFMSLVGHAFTGESTDVKHMYFMIDGSGDSRGDNGKTFIFNIINRIMGAYVAKPKSSLLEKNNTKTHKQIVGLKGKRFVYMEEFPDKALNVDLLKELADGGAMENEIMFGATETINIMAMFFVLSNHTPNLDANESAGYNRYKEVSFCSHFDRTGDRDIENEDDLEYIADATLGDKIVSDHRDEVIGLILQYAMRYYKTGIPRTPIRFLKAEQKTKKANDEFLEWFEEFIEGNEDDRMAEKRIVEMSKLDQKKVRKGMMRLGFKYDKDLSGIGKDITTGKPYKGGYILEK